MADKGIEFYNRLIKLLLQDNSKEMYSKTHNKEKSAVAGKFIRTLKNKNVSKMYILQYQKCIYR